MEQSMKRQKTHDFDSDKEARDYVESLSKGVPELPMDVWVKILSENPDLSVVDISRMCRVNKTFKRICDTGIIWDRILIRQFGREALKEARRYMPDAKDALKRLMATRFINRWTLRTGREAWSWDLRSKTGIVLEFELYEESLPDPGRTYTIILSDRSFGRDAFDLINRLNQFLSERTSMRRNPAIFCDVGRINVSWSKGLSPDTDWLKTQDALVYFAFGNGFWMRRYYHDRMFSGDSISCALASCTRAVGAYGATDAQQTHDESVQCGNDCGAVYCSDACAEKDWKQGGHWQVCQGK